MKDSTMERPFHTYNVVCRNSDNEFKRHLPSILFFSLTYVLVILFKIVCQEFLYYHEPYYMYLNFQGSSNCACT